jgi:hypothetical protein
MNTGHKRGLLIGLAVLAILLGVGLILLARPGLGTRAGFGPLGDAVDDVGDAIEDFVETRFEDPNTSPFEEVEWKDGLPRVKVAGVWYALEAVDGWPTEDLLGYTRRKHGEDRVEKRFEEDLPMLLREGWKKPGPQVLLRLRADDGTITEQQTLMTEANRRRHWQKRSAAPAPPAFTAQAAHAAIDELLEVLRTRHSYTALRAPNEETIADAKQALANGATIEQLAAACMRILATTGDGHAGVEAGTYPDAGPFMDALLFPVGFKQGDPVIAVKPDRSDFIDASRPRLLAVDGVEIEKWIAAASNEVAHGSPQLIRDRSLRSLRSTEHYRSATGAQPKPAGLTLTLSHNDGSNPADHIVPLTTTKPVFGVWPRGKSALISRAVSGPFPEYGYIRLAEMDSDPAFLERIEKDLHQYTREVIIDLRGNSGGSRHAIDTLADFLLPEKADAIVYNAARALLIPGEPAPEMKARLASRMLYAENDSIWTDRQRERIAGFRAGFTPQVEVPADRFSEWHYALAFRRKPGPAYTGRVAVLMDQRCFSAADDCLAALREMGKTREQHGLPPITLVGQPSAGGSGLAREERIAGGRVKLRLSSMVSYMPDGRLFEGRGVQPDIEVTPDPGEFTTLRRASRGHSGDAALDAAFEQLRSK